MTLEITPNWSDPLLHLGLAARLTRLVDISQQQNGSETVLESLEIPGNVSLLPNQTVVLVKDISKQGMGISDSTNSVAGPQTLLVLVTPSIFYGDRVEPGVRLQGIVRKGDEVSDVAREITNQSPQ